MTENEHQKALREWIVKGLEIPAIRKLKGNSSYLLNNMIAKYTLYNDEYSISEKALKRLNSDGIDLNQTYNRKKFYGSEQPYIYEHAIPASVIRKLLCNCKKNEFENIFNNAGIVALILKEEDKKLNQCGLKSKMPEKWKIGEDPKARYQYAGINISNEKLKVKGAVYR